MSSSIKGINPRPYYDGPLLPVTEDTRCYICWARIIGSQFESSDSFSSVELIYTCCDSFYSEGFCGTGGLQCTLCIMMGITTKEEGTKSRSSSSSKSQTPHILLLYSMLAEPMHPYSAQSAKSSSPLHLLH